MRSIMFILAVLAMDAACCVAPSFASNQSAVITALAKQNGVSDELARKQLESVVTAIKGELSAGRDVTIPNFGRFYVSEQAAHEGRNPRTGAKLQIPAKRYPKWTSADNFKEVMNPKSETVPAAAEQSTATKQG